MGRAHFHSLFVSLLCLLSTMGARAASNAPWPERPIHLVVATAAGGAMDVTARNLADRLSTILGQPVVIDNRPGGGSSLAANLVAHAPSDGYTLLFVSSGYATLPALYSRLPFKPSELAPVAVIASAPYLLVVPADAPWKTFSEFVAAAKSHPGELNFASGGNATGGHLLGTWLRAQEGLKIEHIPFKGEGPALQAMLAHQVSLMPVTISAGAGFVQSGKLRALAISGARRSPLLPDVPTLQEELVAVQSVVWFGMLAPAGVPQPVIAKVNEAVNKALQEPELRNKYLNSGMVVEGGSPTDFKQLIQREAAMWTPIIRDAGIHAD